MEADALTTTKEVAENSTSTILWLFGIRSKMESWKSSIGGCLRSWAPPPPKSLFWSVVFSYPTQQQWTISQSDCDMWWKVDFIWQPVIPAQWLDWDEAPEYFPKPNLHWKKVMVTVWWSAAHIWPTAAFWILVKPLHLRCMFSKLMRCTKNCNACSQHWSTGQTNSSPWQCLTGCRTTNTLNVEWIGLQSFSSSAIFI